MKKVFSAHAPLHNHKPAKLFHKPAKWVAALIALASLNANAAAPAAWYNDVDLVNIYGGPASGRLAITINGTVNYGTCPGAEMSFEPPVAVTPPTTPATYVYPNPYFKELFSMIMIAYSTKSKISVFTDGTCTPYGVRLSDVRLQ
jgi:hypothetical protein